MEEKLKPVYGIINFGKERELATASFGYINKDITEIKHDYIRLGFHLAECRDMEYYKDFGYSDFYEFVDKNFYMDKSAVSRCLNIFMKFSAVSGEYTNSHKMYLADEYKEYTYSQLSEMLPLDDKQIKQIKPEMTIAEIRELKKSWKEKKSEKCDVATIKCRWDNQCECEIEEIKNKYFLKGGGYTGCAGCCEMCLDKKECNYICGYAKQKIETADSVIDADYKEVLTEQEGAEIEAEQIVKPQMPILKNVEERENFILSFKDWVIWCQNELTEEIYYRYDLPDGAAIVIRSYPVYLEWKKEETEGRELFLLKPEYKHFKNCESSMTEIKTYLKDLQKK